jgi:uridine kinase
LKNNECALKGRITKNPPKNGKYYVIAIDGRGGSGKTTLLKYVATLLPDFIMIYGDDYFEPTTDTIAWGTFNNERFIADVITPVKNGSKTINYKPYDWHAEPHIRGKKLQITQGICIERSFSFAFDLNWDLKIWVETPSDTSSERGMARDRMPREQAEKQWKEVWQPKEDAYYKEVSPLETADIIIDGTKPFEEQISGF